MALLPAVVICASQDVFEAYQDCLAVAIYYATECWIIGGLSVSTFLKIGVRIVITMLASRTAIEGRTADTFP
jgi:hypothetical protein